MVYPSLEPAAHLITLKFFVPFLSAKPFIFSPVFLNFMCIGPNLLQDSNHNNSLFRKKGRKFHILIVLSDLNNSLVLIILSHINLTVGGKNAQTSALQAGADPLRAEREQLHPLNP